SLYLLLKNYFTIKVIHKNCKFISGQPAFIIAQHHPITIPKGYVSIESPVDHHLKGAAAIQLR
ncbi:hypothetical protein K7A41_00115, partial [Sphingobacterium sp. InxBP1]|uniref:hypothetical protein n=1 Tax=Sphingobacterium sp. InxBP1 TaxID=2870328 RepID=UPI002242F649